MTPDQADTMLAGKLRELGFSEDEVRRQLDRSIPQAARASEREQILARQFAHAASVPGAVQDLVLAHALADVEAKLAKQAPKRTASRRWIWVVVALAVVGAGGALAYRKLGARREPMCEHLLGPLARYEAITGFPLRGDGSEYGDSCSVMVWRTDRTSNPIVSIERGPLADVAMYQADLAGEAFAAHETLKLAVGEAELSFAGDAPEPSADQALAMAAARVGKSRDPIGDALGALPPAHHVVLIRGTDQATKLMFERHAFTPAQVKQLVATITAEWK